MKAEFESWKSLQEIEPSPFEQLYFIYKKSTYYEPEHMRYPVAKIY